MASMSGYRMIATLCVILSLLQLIDAKPKAKANPKIYLVETKSAGLISDGNDYDATCIVNANQVKNDYSSGQDYCAFGPGCMFPWPDPNPYETCKIIVNAAKKNT